MPKTYHTVTILFPPDGSPVTTDIDGLKGPSCTDITKVVEGALGGEVVSSKKKPEFFDKETNKETIKTGH